MFARWCASPGSDVATRLFGLLSVNSSAASKRTNPLRARVCERLNYDLLFKWFSDMHIGHPAFDATTFSKNRQRLLEHQVADEFFAAVVR